MRDIKNIFISKEQNLHSKFDLGVEDIVTIDFKTEQKGNIYLTQYETTCRRNVILENNEGVRNVALYFIKSGVPFYSIDKKTAVEKCFAVNTNGIYFMQEDSSSREFNKKNSQKGSTSIHFSFEYFKQLTELYPDLFENAFLRYEKGESFYLKEQFEPTTSEQYHILSQIENAHFFGNGQQAYIDAKVLELLCFQFQNPQDKSLQLPVKTVKDYDNIREARSILLSNIHTPPSLRTLALQVGINEKKLKCGFKEVYNNTVYGYLFDYKMQLAEQLLQDTSKSIAEIALQCGYEYPSHFCTAFKRKFGVSPRQKRSNH